MRNLPLLTVSLAALTLSGCALFRGEPVSPATQQDINTGAVIFCGLAEAADDVFNARNKDPDRAKAEAVVYAGFHEACKPPYTLDLPTITKKAIDAYNAIKALTPAAP